MTNPLLQRLALPWSRSVLAVLLLLSAFPGDGYLRAEEQKAAGKPETRVDFGPQIEAVRVGFAGAYKTGVWTPVTVVLRGGKRPVTGRLQLTVPDGDGVGARLVVSSGGKPLQLRLPPGRTTEVRACVRLGRVAGWLLVEFLPDDGPAVRRRFTAGRGEGADFPPAVELRSLIVVLGADAKWVEEAVGSRGTSAGPQPVVACVSQASELPDRWYAYEGVDVVAVATSRLEVFERLPASESPAPRPAAHSSAQNVAQPAGGLLSEDDPRLEALRRWVELGGRVLILAGRQTPKVLAQGGPLAAFAPGELEEMSVLRDASPLETYGESVRPVPREGGRLTLPLPRWAQVDGRVEAEYLGIPLVVRSARGFGRVTVVAADLDGEPWASWSDRRLLVARLLDLPEAEEEPSEESSALMHFGYQNMAGQLRSALDQFEGVSAVPFALVAVLLAVYVLLLGPADYLFLRKLIGRMEWTWLTFPLLVAVFCVGTWALAGWLKGRRLRVHQAEVIDVDAASGRVRATSWAGVFCAHTSRYDFTLRPHWPGVEAEDFQVLAAWHGLPGRALGGMNPQAGELTMWEKGYDWSPRLDTLRGVPVAAWSTKSLTARWHCRAETFPRASLAEQNDVLEGTITNALPCPLQDCVLAYEHDAYQLGDLEPGETCRLELTTPRMAVKTWLTGIRMVTAGMEGADEEATPYDQSSRKPDYILRTMSFFRASGGRSYTGLGNEDCQFVDLSMLLSAGRAILFARLPGQANDLVCGSRWWCNAQEPAQDAQQRTVLLRVVFPVKLQE